MNRWFRFYDDTINDPKILKLSDRLYRVWTGMLCLASKNNGVLPEFDDMVIMLRTKAEKLQPELEQLIKAGLLDHSNAGIAPHNWNVRQYKSDVSTDRVKRFRQQQRNVSETPPETETETETETEAEIEKKKVVADATPPKTKADRNGTRLPEDWRPIDEDGAYAARLGIDVSRTIEDFRDYWVSKAGAAARKADWGRTWRKWARRTADDLRQPARSRAGGGIGSDLAEAGQLAASRLREKRESSGDFRLQSGFGIGAETTGAGTLIRQNNHVSGPLVPAGHDGDDTVGDDRRLAGRVR